MTEARYITMRRGDPRYGETLRTGMRLAGSPSGHGFTPYRYRDPDASARRRALTGWIAAQVGDEADSWDLPEDPPVLGDDGKPVQPCGTWAAYLRHLYHHEDPCDACREACAERADAQRRNAGQPRSRDVIAGRLAKLASWRIRENGGGALLPGYITAAEAAERLGVDVRTITRYRKKLREQQEQEAMAS